MNSKHVLIDGRRELLGPRLGRGGEGEIFPIEDGSGRAVKLYLRPDDLRRRKVEAMIRAKLASGSPSVAFPTSAVTTLEGKFAGFAMSLVAQHQPLHELYSTNSRRRLFPNVDFRFQVRVAANAARAVAAVHAAGAVIGDLNHSSIMVSRSATTMLIDADSFQFAGHRCRVGVAEYTPPELQGKDLGDLERNTNHDAFGLAVLIFQTMALGRHPYAGFHNRRDTGLAAAIAGDHFAYSLVRGTGNQAPAASVSLGDMPLGIRTAFERSFGMVAGPRPTPADWVRELERFETGLMRCVRNDRHHFHVAAGACPWCRIESKVPITIFGKGEPAAPSTAHPGQDRALDKRMKNAINVAKAATRSVPADHMKQPFTVNPSFKPAVAARPAGNVLDHRRDLLPSIGAGTNVVEIENVVAALERNRAIMESIRALAACPEISARQAARCAMIAEVLIARNVAACLIPGLGAKRHGLLVEQGIYTALDLSWGRLRAIKGLDARAIAELLVWRDTVAAIVDIPGRVDERAAKMERARRFEMDQRVEARKAETERLLVKLTLLLKKRTD